jgi:D-glycero-D-manno-heptose 1,7-bisphosphate phosphatase
MIRCVFFDRDGIVNRPPPAGDYVPRWEEFELMPGFAPVMRAARDKGYAAVIVTNQRGVARGLVARAAVEDIHRRLRQRLAEEHGLELLDVLYCPHEEGACECRKPRPGLLLRAARRHGIDLASSWMIGDTDRDVEAGRRAGCRTILVSAAASSAQPDHQVADLRELRDRMAEWL